MPEHIRALVYVLILSMPALYVAGRLAVRLVGPKEFVVWRNAWLVTTCLTFLSPSFLVFACAIAVISVVVHKRVRDPHLLYIVLMFAAPCIVIGFGIPGVFNRITDMTYPRLLGLVFLMPSTLVLLTVPQHRMLRQADWGVAGFWLLLSTLAFRHGDLPSVLRILPGYAIDILLPYFVISRAIRSREDLNRAFVALIVAALPLAAVGLFELWRDWRVYYVVVQRWEVVLITPYLFRDGLLRAATTSVEPIAFGFVCMTAAAALLAVRAPGLERRWRAAALALLMGGLYASISRGPWLGFAFAIAVMLLADPKALGRVAVVGVPVALLALQLLPNAIIDRFVNLLPFIGEADQGSETYREQLFEKSLMVIEQHPLFGSKDFLAAPELQSLIQGQGIIDVVNTYIQVALEYGLVGLLLFVSIFGVLVFQVLLLWGRDRSEKLYYPAILGMTLAVLFTIATTSSVTVIPVIYWILAGLLAGLVRMQQPALTSASRTPTAETVMREAEGGISVDGSGARGLRVLGRGI